VARRESEGPPGVTDEEHLRRAVNLPGCALPPCAPARTVSAVTACPWGRRRFVAACLAGRYTPAAAKARDTRARASSITRSRCSVPRKLSA